MWCLDHFVCVIFSLCSLDYLLKTRAPKLCVRVSSTDVSWTSAMNFWYTTYLVATLTSTAGTAREREKSQTRKILVAPFLRQPSRRVRPSPSTTPHPMTKAVKEEITISITLIHSGRLSWVWNSSMERQDRGLVPRPPLPCWRGSWLRKECYRPWRRRYSVQWRRPAVDPCQKSDGQDQSPPWTSRRRELVACDQRVLTNRIRRRLILVEYPSLSL